MAESLFKSRTTLFSWGLDVVAYMRAHTDIWLGRPDDIRE